MKKVKFEIAHFVCLQACLQTCLFSNAGVAGENIIQAEKNSIQKLKGDPDTLDDNTIYTSIKQTLPEFPEEQAKKILEEVVKPYLEKLKEIGSQLHDTETNKVLYDATSDNIITALYAFHLFYRPDLSIGIEEPEAKGPVTWEYLEFNQSMKTKTRFDHAINSARALLVLLPTIIEEESQLSRLPCDRSHILEAFFACTRIDPNVIIGCHPEYYNPYIIGELNGNLLIKNIRKYFRITDYKNGFVRIIGELFDKKSTNLSIEKYLREHRSRLLGSFFTKNPTVFGIPDFSEIDRKVHLSKIYNYLSAEFDELGEKNFIEKYLNDFYTQPKIQSGRHRLIPVRLRRK